MLCRKIRRHHRAFLAYDHLAPFGEPVDPRFCLQKIDGLDRWQARESRRRLYLLAHPVQTFADMLGKANYLLTYPGR